MGLSLCRTESHSTFTRTMNHTDYNRIYFLPHIMSRFETCTIQLACLRSPRGTFIPSILWAQKPRPATRAHIWGVMPSLGKAAQENSRDAIILQNEGDGLFQKELRVLRGRFHQATNQDSGVDRATVGSDTSLFQFEQTCLFRPDHQTARTNASGYPRSRAEQRDAAILGDTLPPRHVGESGKQRPASGICRRTTLVLDKASGHFCEKRSTFPCRLAGAAHEVCPEALPRSVGATKTRDKMDLGGAAGCGCRRWVANDGANGTKKCEAESGSGSGSESANSHIVVGPKSWPHDPRIAGNCLQGTEAMDRHIRDKDILLVPVLGCWVEPRRTTASWDQRVGDSESSML